MKITIGWTAAIAGGAAATIALAAAFATASAPGPSSTASAPAASPARVVRHGEMSVPRAAHQATLLASGSVLITGGCADPGCDEGLASAELYDPAARSFRPVAAMSTPRRDHAAARLPDGRVLVVGGWAEAATRTAEIYDPESDRWTSVGPMAVARGGPVAVRLRDGRVLVAGGWSQGASASAEIFDPVASTFSAAVPMRAPRRRADAVALADGRVLVSGGGSAEEGVLRSVEIFDPATGAFRTAGEMAVPRWAHGSALLADGRVLVLGGSAPEGPGRGRDDRVGSTEIYDPATGRFSPGPELRSPRRKIAGAVVSLTSGRVLVAGGSPRPEIWERVAAGFVPLHGELEGRHEFATATLLPTGEVLLLGGYDERIRPSAAAWLVTEER